MATREVVEGMLIHFSELCGKNLTEELIKAHCHAYRNKTDDQIKIAGYKMLEDLNARSPFPRPGDIIARIPMEATELNENFKWVLHGTCDKCGKRGIRCIREPKDNPEIECADCYSGMTHEQRQAKFREIIAMMDAKKMESTRASEESTKELLRQQKADLEGGW